MELKRMVAPFDATEALEHLEKIFGVEERLLEECQLDGSETKWNKDIVYFAYEGKTLLGMIHGTIPEKTPCVAGLSAMFTTEAARGKGIGKLLFGKIVEEVSGHNVQLTVLGTSNPVAAKLYAQFGFGFCPGSHVMAWFSQGNMVDFTQEHYQQLRGSAAVVQGDPAMRIPLVPLVLQREYGLILDINTGIFNSDTVTQYSCMGLYPRYIALRQRGGDYFMAMDEAGTLGAVGSVAPKENGANRADFFSVPAFRSVIPEMIRKMEEAFGKVYFEIACGDSDKASILKENGYTPIGEGCCAAGDLMIKTVKYSK
jgi:GNAT superfamily N-acetyltransferase